MKAGSGNESQWILIEDCTNDIDLVCMSEPGLQDNSENTHAKKVRTVIWLYQTAQPGW
jgi:hypothetical protein